MERFEGQNLLNFVKELPDDKNYQMMKHVKRIYQK